uniref:SKI-interacting protein SKIP SNW domain-containing protein n=1 Tax=Pinguiococcus pyrenoidosus TaxID=172671 RepID=A0A7R9U6T3_9STRA
MSVSQALTAFRGTARLPPPQQRKYVVLDDAVKETRKSIKEPPAYLQRHNFFPRTLDDFGDGGAFPEIHMTQFPRNMGRKDGSHAPSSDALSVEVDAEGRIRYDAIVKQGVNRNRMVQTTLAATKEKDLDGSDKLAMPTQDEATAAAEKTKAAMAAIIAGKVAKTRPTAIRASERNEQFFRYTPDPSAPGYNPNVKQRVIKMVDHQIDPMEPPKHKHVKVPAGAGDPPVPVLHSASRKVTVEDQQAWQVPPCVSNWKNQRGYTISLDKRLAADGRGLIESTVNDKFAVFAESMYIAEKKTREELTEKKQLRKRIQQRAKEQYEQQMLETAREARMTREGRGDNKYRSKTEEDYADHERSDDEDQQFERRRDREVDREPVRRDEDEDRESLEKRERLRLERRREREREMRLANLKGNAKKQKMDRERDVSEKIALGLQTGATKLAGDAQYDSRLFNQDAGLDSGFGNDEEYDAYSKPLLGNQTAKNIYVARKSDATENVDQDKEYRKLQDSTKRFRPDKGFAGAEGGASSKPRNAPVQFEKSS